jgi:hypothetical protein
MACMATEKKLWHTGSVTVVKVIAWGGNATEIVTPSNLIL